MSKSIEFVPVDYDYFDFGGENFVRMIGRRECFARWQVAGGRWQDLENLGFSCFSAWRSCESIIKKDINFSLIAYED